MKASTSLPSVSPEQRPEAGVGRRTPSRTFAESLDGPPVIGRLNHGPFSGFARLKPVGHQKVTVPARVVLGRPLQDGGGKDEVALHQPEPPPGTFTAKAIRKSGKRDILQTHVSLFEALVISERRHDRLPGIRVLSDQDEFLHSGLEGSQEGPFKHGKTQDGPRGDVF